MNIKFIKLINSRLLVILGLGFSSGLPLALTGSTLQAWFTESGINLMSIGALTLLGIPYLLKFTWAPLMDRICFTFLGRRRGWILLTQISLSITLFLLAQLHPEKQAVLIGMVALLIAFLSASQDVAIDAYRTELLLPEERGLGTAYYIFAYRTALLLSGGAALILAEYAGWQLTYEIMAILLASFTFITCLAPSTTDFVSKSEGLIKLIVEPFIHLWQQDKIVWLLLFIMFYKLGDSLALSLMTNFLLHGLGFSLSEIGIAYKTNSIIATILGAFIGGLFLTKQRNLFTCLFTFGILQAGSTLLFAMLALAGKNYGLMALAIFVENFCSGLSTAAFVSFLMSLCNSKFAATQFALFSAIASLGRVFLGPFAASMVLHMGWVNFYLWSFFLSFPGIILLLCMRQKVLNYALAQ